MASKLSFLNSLMGRKKPKDNNTDELAMVKAAAWAWYQHGSGYEGKVTSEFDVTRTHHAKRPSRYKLEAMTVAKEAKGGSQFHTNESLLDAYEVQSISRQLNSYIDQSNRNKVVDSEDASVDVGGRKMKKKKKKKKIEKKIRKGFWLGNVAVCGREEDVVDHGALRDCNRQMVKRVPAVSLVKCSQMANGTL